MSQFDPAMQYTNPYVEAPRTSGLAVAALVCSLFICLPLAPLGVLLGIIALVVIGANANLRGRGLALAAIILGLIVSAGWAYGGWKMYTFMREVYQFVVAGPGPALQAGTTGDVAAFQAAFTGTGSTIDSAVAQEFLETLNTRYGTFISARLDESAGNAQPTPGQAVATLPYVLQFTNGTVDAEAELVFADQATGRMILQLDSLTIEDADLGNLRFPPLPAPPTGPSDASGGAPEGG